MEQRLNKMHDETGSVAVGIWSALKLYFLVFIIYQILHVCF
jgi:hypothetical protein